MHKIFNQSDENWNSFWVSKFMKCEMVTFKILGLKRGIFFNIKYTYQFNHWWICNKTQHLKSSKNFLDSKCHEDEKPDIQYGIIFAREIISFSIDLKIVYLLTGSWESLNFFGNLLPLSSKILMQVIIIISVSFIKSGIVENMIIWNKSEIVMMVILFLKQTFIFSEAPTLIWNNFCQSK